MAEITTPNYQIRYATEHDVPVILQLISELASYEHALHEVLATPEKLFETLTFPTSSDPKVRSKAGFAKTLLIIPRQNTSSSTSDPAQEASARQEVETSTNATSTSNNSVPSGGRATSDPAQQASARVEVETSTNASTTTTTASKEVEGKDVVAGFALYFNNYSTWLAQPGIYLEDLFVRPAYRKRGLGKALLQALARECVAEKYGRLEWSVLKWNQPSIDFYVSETVGAKDLGEEWSPMRVTGDALVKLAASKP